MSKDKSNHFVMPSSDGEFEPPSNSGGFELSLEDTVAQRQRGLSVSHRTTVTSGYNPYDASPKAPSKDKDASRKPTDLRKLSEWIRLQRQVEALKKDPIDDES